MPIKAPEPKTVEATQAKTYQDIWFPTWVFNKANPTDPGWLRIDKRYHDAETGEVLEGAQGDAGRIYHADLDEIIANVPEAAAAYGALLAAVEPIEAFLAAKAAEDADPEEE